MKRPTCLGVLLRRAAPAAASAILAAGVLALPVPARAQQPPSTPQPAAEPGILEGWYNQRFNNPMFNADTISARFRSDIRDFIAHQHRAELEETSPSASDRQAVQNLQTWWQQQISVPLEPASKSLKVGLGSMYDSALANSWQIRSYADLPAIRETGEAEVNGKYVPHAYGEGRIANLNDPTLSEATTLGSPRLIQRERNLELGVRQQIQTGGEITAGQRFGSISTNSIDYLPQQQSTAGTFISIVQPLLQGSGTQYARSLHEIARLDTNSGVAEFRRQTESHLVEVARAYWGLELARSNYLQKKRLVDATKPLTALVAGRTGIDADELLITRTQSALDAREADLLRARVAVRNAEARLRGLVNDPRFDQQQIGELLPTDPPLTRFEPKTLEDILVSAVTYRPEVQQLFNQHQQAVLREGLAENDNLPKLDVVLEGNMGGRGNIDQYGVALQNYTTNQGRPGGVAGLRLDIPLGADQSAAQLARRRLETRQAENQSLAAISTIVVEAEVTLNEYRVAFRDMAARAVALAATQKDVDLQTARLRDGIGVAGTPGAGSAAGALDRLLDAQDRLARAEDALANAQAVYTVAFIQLQRVSGTFTALEKIDYGRNPNTPRGTTYTARRAQPGAPVAAPK